MEPVQWLTQISHGREITTLVIGNKARGCIVDIGDGWYQAVAYSSNEIAGMRGSYRSQSVARDALLVMYWRIRKMENIRKLRVRNAAS
jgi:hypothetical protein